MAEIRPMRVEDVAEASLMSFNALRDMANELTVHDPWPEQRPPERVKWGDYRLEHICVHDPGGSWVAVEDHRIVGVALATKRDSIWFLSLLAVATDVQTAGTGRRLLDAALTYAADCEGAWIMSSVDPRALRRYQQAGFELHPGYEFKATVDRSLLPVAPSWVRDGEIARDAELIDDVARAVRGAAFGPDLDYHAKRGQHVLVAELGDERGFALFGPESILNVAASSPALGAALLTEAAGLASQPTVSIMAVTAAQQWAIDTAMALRMSPTPGTSLCFRGRLGPMTAYLANGMFG